MTPAPRGEPPWHILAGEYPPQPGGVADYTALVAAALAEDGAEVHVWAPPAAGGTPEVPGVAVHREADGWGPSALRRLGRALDAHAPPRRLLVQYTPYSWGARGLNLAFPRWLGRRARRGDEVWAMVHEVAYPFLPGDPPWRWLRAALHRRMARDLLAASGRVFCSIPRFGEELRRLDPRPGRAALWLPVPSTIPALDDPAGAREVRARVAPGGGAVLGSFGTFSHPTTAGPLRGALPALLAAPGRVALLIGRGGDRFAAQVEARHPGLRGRVVATGALGAADVSRHLHACDLVVLPFSDGVSTRRTTAMAALAHGLPTVTTDGVSTEPLWRDSGAVALVPADDPGALAEAAGALLADPARRGALGASARALYARRFAPGRTASALRGVGAPALEVEPGGPGAYTAPSGPRRAPGSPRP